MANTLHKLHEFQQLLSDYHISDENRGLLSQMQLVLLTGASSTGRNTLIRELEKTSNYHFIVSDTTRQPRVNDGTREQNGIEYWFKTEDEFLTGLRNGDYLEAEIIHGQQVSGMSMRELRKVAAEHKIAITDIDIGGIQNVMNAKPDTIPIVMLPPSFQEWQDRIQNRGVMPEAELKRRMSTALTIFERAASNTDFLFLISEDVHISSQKVEQMVKHEHIDAAEQAAGRVLAQRLYVQTKDFVSK